MGPGYGTRVGWLTAVCVAAILGVNAAGAWGIAVARRGVHEEAARMLRLETAARARGLESALSDTRADLAFLAGSPALSGLAGRAEGEDRGRAAAEGALLVFLRGHPEVGRLTAATPEGETIIQTGWRGGVPVLWHPTTGDAPAAGGPPETVTWIAKPPRVSVVGMDPHAPAGTRGLRLEVELGPRALSTLEGPGAEQERVCVLRDATGAELAREPAGSASPDAGADDLPSGWVAADAAVRVEGWSAPSPWRLACLQNRGTAVALLDPIAARYRTTLALNLGVMALALLLGGFAIQQARRRERLEAVAREEARVRELERQLFHAERLGTVGRLAAGMAHEINNPLEGMSNYVSLAREDLARGDAASARARLDRVQEGIDRVAGIVRQVLAHADPAAAPQSPVEVRSVLEQTVEFVRSRGEFGRIEFGLDIEDSPLVVLGSPVMLGQVALNLVLNACEAQPGGGEVRVRAWRENGEVRVEIADRGPGVPAEASARIFEPFYSTKQSTGLGLSICHSIVRRHDGELNVQDRPGGGAVFTMRLPSREARA